jgi:hypothetical protein
MWGWRSEPARRQARQGAASPRVERAPRGEGPGLLARTRGKRAVPVASSWRSLASSLSKWCGSAGRLLHHHAACASSPAGGWSLATFLRLCFTCTRRPGRVGRDGRAPAPPRGAPSPSRRGRRCVLAPPARGRASREVVPIVEAGMVYARRVASLLSRPAHQLAPQRRPHERRPRGCSRCPRAFEPHQPHQLSRVARGSAGGVDFRHGTAARRRSLPSSRR